jgi:Spy/CpxP family protein refolding chaperone
MKRINFLFFTGLTILLTLFCISSLGWAQTKKQAPLRKYLSQVGQIVPQPRPAPVPEQGEFGDMRIDWRELDLSEEQRETIQQKRRDFQVQTASIRTELRFCHQDLQVEIRKDITDHSRIESLLNDISTLSVQLSEAAVRNILAIKEILTPDQLGKLQAFQFQIPPELERLRLTPEQRTQFQDIVRNSTREVRKTTERLQDLKVQLLETLLEQNVDSERLSQLQSEIAEAELIQRETRVNMQLQLKEILTPEQLKLWQRPEPKRGVAPPVGTRNG